VETVFRGKRDVVRFAVSALLARGHVLCEDIPGVGKAALARALAAALGLSFRRIPFTSDLLPSTSWASRCITPRRRHSSRPVVRAAAEGVGCAAHA
jgi:MoxR-like ATPase